MEKFTFSEVQKFSKAFVLPLIILTTSLTVGLLSWGIFQQIVLKHHFGNNPVSDISLLLISAAIILFVLALDWLFLNAKLITEINRETIRYRYFPFILRDRFIYWQDIDKAYIRQYKPIKEYGGWGIKFGISGNGKALNVKGNYGLQLEFKNGKNLLIGTQKKEELEALLVTLGIKKN